MNRQFCRNCSPWTLQPIVAQQNLELLMGIGMGLYVEMGVATVLVLIVLWAIPLLQRLTHARQTLTYDVLVPLQDKNDGNVYAIMEANNLSVADRTMSKESTGIRYMWRAYGKPKNHQNAMLALADDVTVQEFRVV